MRALLAALTGLALLAGCGDEEGPPEANGDDVVEASLSLPGDPRWIEVEHPEGGSVWCLYLYEGGFRQGGPALWCERPGAGQR